MNDIRYGQHFGANEWFILSAFVVGALLVLLAPRRFNPKTSSVFLMCGVFFGFFFDHTLSVFPVSFYRINDTSKFETMDFISHIIYAPVSYFFFYLYDLFHIRIRNSLLYVLAWAFASCGFERISEAAGVFHYENGYKILYSFVIYLVVQTLWVFFYRAIMAYGDKRF